MAIRGGRVKSVKALKNSMKKGGNFGGLKRVGEDPLTVRFLQEPEEWFEFFEHYDEREKRYVVCTDDCDYCADDSRPSKRALANVVVIDESKVEPLAMAATLVSRLLNRYDKYGTLLDRDYEIIRSGKGFDTEYDVTPEDARRMNLGRFEILDLQEVLEGLSPEEDDEDEKPVVKRKSGARRTDDEDDEDERPARKTRASSGRTKSKPVEPEDEDEDDDDEDDKFLRPSRGGVKPKSRASASNARSTSPLGKGARPKPRSTGLRK